MDTTLLAPFPYFGGKRKITTAVWQRFGDNVKHYIEPFCGSAAMLLAAPQPASLEVVCDINGFIANFWRAVANQPDHVAHWADYPVSHIDLGARHKYLMQQRDRLADELQDADWPGDAKAAGWWLWGQCCWIGSGWCDWTRFSVSKAHQIPHITDAGQGIQAIGKIPHITDAGRGVQAIGKTTAGGDEFLTSSGQVAADWLRLLSTRLNRVRIIHGQWDRCLNHHYGKDRTAVFLDPPYRKYAGLYHCPDVADAVASWARDHGDLRIALCGHAGDYDLPDWDVVPWSRRSSTYGSSKTLVRECIWYSPGCVPASCEDYADCISF